jgi:hypothetical protein
VRVKLAGGETLNAISSGETRLRKVMRWLLAETQEGRGPYKKEEMLEAVRAAHPGDNISENLLAVALEESGTRGDLTYRGRPRERQRKK